MTLIFILFLAGFIQEILITSYHKALIEDRRLTASSLTAIVAVIGLIVISEIFKLVQNNHSIYGFLLIGGYALGKFCGAYARLSIKKEG